MSVEGFCPVFMEQADVIAVAGAAIGHADHPVQGRQHRRPLGAGQIHPLMEPPLPLCRVAPPAVARGHPPGRGFQREIQIQRPPAAGAAVKQTKQGHGTAKQPVQKPGCRAGIYHPGRGFYTGCPFDVGFGGIPPLCLHPDSLLFFEAILCGGAGGVFSYFIPRDLSRRLHQLSGAGFTTTGAGTEASTGRAGWAVGSSFGAGTTGSS